jgi:hypothetical protein
MDVSMITIQCARCGATVIATRTGPNTHSLSYSTSFLQNCIQARERLAATGEEKDPTKCSDMDDAVKRAAVAGRI